MTASTNPSTTADIRSSSTTLFQGFQLQKFVLRSDFQMFKIDPADNSEPLVNRVRSLFLSASTSFLNRCLLLRFCTTRKTNSAMINKIKNVTI